MFGRKKREKSEEKIVATSVEKVEMTIEEPMVEVEVPVEEPVVEEVVEDEWEEGTVADLTYHIKWALLNDKVEKPTKNKGDGGYDVYVGSTITEDVIIPAGEVVKLDTGISYEITEGWHLVAKERGSSGGINLQTRAGLNDNIYRGEITAFLSNGFKDKTIVISIDERATREKLLVEYGMGYVESFVIYPASKAVQQLMPVYSPDGTDEVVKYKDLSETKRGKGKEGSSGK